jgi:ketosteroid isomerase-like protein
MGEDLSRERVVEWLSGYVRAWRSAGTEQLSELFTRDATYLAAPYEEASEGIEAIGELWEAERTGPDEAFTMASEIVAVDGDTAVARVEVSYNGPPSREYRDLWVIRFADDGRCRAFEEWPFWPGQPLSASEG